MQTKHTLHNASTSALGGDKSFHSADESQFFVLNTKVTDYLLETRIFEVGGGGEIMNFK